MSLYKDASLVMIPSAYKDGKLYSIRPTDGSGDFTFSRGSNLAATRVDVNGLIEKGRENLLLQSNNFNTTWFTNAGVSVTSGQSGYDGSNDAWLLSSTTGSQYASLRQTIATSGVTTASFYAKANTLNFIVVSINGNAATYQWFDLANGVVGTNLYGNEIDASIESVGNGWYRCSLTFSDNNIVSARAYPVGADNTFTTTAGSIYIQDAQLEQGLVTTDYIETGTSAAQSGILEDMPRLDYSGGASCPSLLLEPQRSNLFPHSEYFDTFNSDAGEVRTPNSIVSPEGVLNGYTLAANNGGSSLNIYDAISVTSGADYVFSVWLKKKTTNEIQIYQYSTQTPVGFVSRATIDFDAGTITDVDGSGATIEPFDNGWFRCSIKCTAPSASLSNGIYNTDGGADIYAYGAQIEAGSYPTSYIPTYGTSQTRSADDCVSSNIDGLIGDNQGTLFVQGFGEYRTGADNHLISLSSLAGGTGTDRILIYTNNTTGNLQVYIDNGSVAQYGAPINLGVQGTDANDKIAVAFADNDLSIYVNGSKVGSSTSGTAPTMFYLAFNEWVGNHQNTSQYKQAAIFPTRLTDAELAALTS